MMNEETEQFEQRLVRQPLRQIPPDWRAEILAAACATPAARHASRSSHQSWLSTFNQQLSTLFWPHPKAWAGLASVWICIFALNFSMRDNAPVVAAKIAPPSPEMIVELRKQQKLFAELMGPRETAVADRPKNFSPQPRSGRAEILVG